MEPNYDNNAPSGYTNDQVRNRKKILTIAVILIVVLFVVFIGSMASRSSQFRLDHTTPNLNNIATITPRITFTFTQPLSSQGLKVTSDQDFISSYKVNGKDLELTINSPVNERQTYIITLVSVSSTSGQHISNKSYTFIAKDINFENLSKDQQQAILQKQTARTPSKDNYTYVGITALTDNGLTQDQVGDLKQALFQYFQSTKKNVQDVTFSNVTPPIPHPNDPLAPDVTTFTVSFANETYNAKLATTNISTARLYLYDTKTSSLVYDSKDINIQK